MADLQCQDDQLGAPNFAEHPVVTDPVAPDPSAITRETLSAGAGVVERADVV